MPSQIYSLQCPSTSENSHGVQIVSIIKFECMFRMYTQQCAGRKTISLQLRPAYETICNNSTYKYYVMYMHRSGPYPAKHMKDPLFHRQVQYCITFYITVLGTHTRVFTNSFSGQWRGLRAEISRNQRTTVWRSYPSRSWQWFGHPMTRPTNASASQIFLNYFLKFSWESNQNIWKNIYPPSASTHAPWCTLVPMCFRISGPW